MLTQTIWTFDGLWDHDNLESSKNLASLRCSIIFRASPASTLGQIKKNYSQRNGDAGASCNGTYAPWCSKPHGVTEQFRPWRARAKSCGRLVGFAAGRRLLWCGSTRIWIARNYIIQNPVMPKLIGPRFNSADLSINVLIVFGCVWMILGEVLILYFWLICRGLQPWYPSSARRRDCGMVQMALGCWATLSNHERTWSNRLQ